MRYEPLYRDFPTSEARALWLVAQKGYGTLTALAEDLGVCITYVSNRILKKGLTLKQAGYLGRKWKVHPGAFCYEAFLELSELRRGTVPAPYHTLLVNSFFDEQDVKYILKGRHVKNAAAWITEHDAEVVKAARKR